MGQTTSDKENMPVNRDLFQATSIGDAEVRATLEDVPATWAFWKP